MQIVIFLTCFATYYWSCGLSVIAEKQQSIALLSAVILSTFFLVVVYSSSRVARMNVLHGARRGVVCIFHDDLTSELPMVALQTAELCKHKLRSPVQPSLLNMSSSERLLPSCMVTFDRVACVLELHWKTLFLWRNNSLLPLAFRIHDRIIFASAVVGTSNFPRNSVLVYFLFKEFSRFCQNSQVLPSSLFLIYSKSVL